MTLVPNDERDMLKKYKKIWTQIKDFIGSANYNSDDCDEKYMKIKFSSDDDLPLQKISEKSGLNEKSDLSEKSGQL